MHWQQSLVISSATRYRSRPRRIFITQRLRRTAFTIISRGLALHMGAQAWRQGSRVVPGRFRVEWVQGLNGRAEALSGMGLEWDRL